MRHLASTGREEYHLNDSKSQVFFILKPTANTRLRYFSWDFVHFVGHFLEIGKILQKKSTIVIAAVPPRHL